MRALILAAGMGTRLQPLTNDKPKSMIEVNGTPILLKQIENLVKYNIKDIIVVAGYKSDILQDIVKEKYPFVKVLINEKHDITNNMYSAYLASDYFYGKEFLLMNADVFYDDTVIAELIKDEYISSIVVDKGTYIEESMKVRTDSNRIIEISKHITENDVYGTSIDVYKFSADSSRLFFNKLIYYIEEKLIVNQWTEVALNDILSETEFKPCPLNGRWIEIDNLDDLKKAKRIFNE